MSADREIVISRVVDASRELVFEAFTEARHLSHWWGPDGFTVTTRAFAFRVGGVWDFVLHGPDGTDYQEWITWTEITAPERIAFSHGESRDDPDAFESVLTFTSDGAATRIEMRTLFPTAQARDAAVEQHRAIEGGEQTLGSLAAYVARTSAQTTCHMSISLDGFVAGPEQSRERPLGRGGREVHRWHLGDERATDADRTAAGWLMRPRGAYVMGRNMFGPIRGEWTTEDWRGWWGPEPPYHAPVFVLTHHAHEPIEMEGGTTFHFVTDGFDAAFAEARSTADGRGVDIAGGASVVRQALGAGVVDELTLDIAPVLLGAGERLFDGVGSFGMEPVEVLHSPLATHVRYRRGDLARG